MAPDIIKLPPELIEHIFEFVPKANDRRRLAQTCWTFYRAVRRQSMRSNTLYLTKEVSDKSHVRVFENSSMFPFSKLHLNREAPAINHDRDFWMKHGHNITELTTENRFTLNWQSLFPNLKKLTVRDRLDYVFGKPEEMKENAPKIQLPIEELCIGPGLTITEVCYILQSSPSLKNCELFVKKSEDLALLHPWIESIEKVKLNLDQFIRLKDILNIPSKVVFKTICIPQCDRDTEPYINFFNVPRTIETVVLSFCPYQSGYSVYLREKLLQLLRAKSIKRLKLMSRVPKFPNSLDLCADIPGLEAIDILLYSEVILHPHYWSNPKTASIIRKLEFDFTHFVPENVSNLTSLTTLIGSIDEHGQLEVVRNHLSLKKLVIKWFGDFDDAELEPISDLHDLEVLELKYANKITPVAFETIIRFPKLKKLVVEMKKITNSIVTSLAKNCPNLEELNLFEIKKKDSENVEDDAQDAINDEGFEHLIRSLPYLKSIEIRTERHATSWRKVEELKIEFPYLKINRFG